MTRRISTGIEPSLSTADRIIPYEIITFGIPQLPIEHNILNVNQHEFMKIALVKPTRYLSLVGLQTGLIKVNNIDIIYIDLCQTFIRVPSKHFFKKLK